jgi:hypothetical protein
VTGEAVESPIEPERGQGGATETLTGGVVGCSGTSKPAEWPAVLSTLTTCAGDIPFHGHRHTDSRHAQLLFVAGSVCMTHEPSARPHTSC